MIKSEIISQEIRVIDSKNKTLIGLCGKVVDETKNTLSVETKAGVKKIIKKDVTLKVFAGEAEKIVKGEELVGKPLERIKKSESKKRW